MVVVWHRGQGLPTCYTATTTHLFTPYFTMSMFIEHYSPSGSINISKAGCFLPGQRVFRNVIFLTYLHLCGRIYLSQIQTMTSITVNNATSCYLMKCDFFHGRLMANPITITALCSFKQKGSDITKGKPRIKSFHKSYMYCLNKVLSASYHYRNMQNK